MITKHSTLTERYLRGLPLVGLIFLFVQAKRHLQMAKEDDQAFAFIMNDMGKEPEEYLLNQNVQLEWRLIITSGLVITASWWVSWLFLGHFGTALWLFLAMCNAISVDYVFGEIVSRLSFRYKASNS